VVVEIHNWNRVGVHANVAEVVDALLRGFARPPVVRFRDESGELRTEEPPRGQLTSVPDGGFGIAGRGSLLDDRRPAQAPRPGPLDDRPFERPRHRPERGFGAGAAADEPRGIQEHGLSREGGLIRQAPEAQMHLAIGERPAQPERAATGVRIYPYGVNRSKLEQVVRGWPALVTHDLEDADVVLTMKQYYRRKPQALRDAEAHGLPIYVLRSGSSGQIEEVVSRIVHRDMAAPGSIAAQALQETEDAIARVLEGNQPVELSPQGSYIRRLQHQLADQYNLGSRSSGREPNRRVQIFRRAE
jgi:hypothetical protein